MKIASMFRNSLFFVVLSTSSITAYATQATIAINAPTVNVFTSTTKARSSAADNSTIAAAFDGITATGDDPEFNNFTTNDEKVGITNFNAPNGIDTLRLYQIWYAPIGNETLGTVTVKSTITTSQFSSLPTSPTTTDWYDATKYETTLGVFNSNTQGIWTTYFPASPNHTNGGGRAYWDIAIAAPANTVALHVEFGGTAHDLRLWEVQGLVTPIPEPSSFVLISTVVISMAGYVRRRKQNQT